ncbi:MAG: 5-oxoprolinase, partial [Verrucomicrobiaceae bacterium]|nr:5-oxoprolinase [Verrucomicrobiaceae bacterium]
MIADSNLRMWHFSADTGGTFTDCFAITPEGTEKRCKVLSSGCIRTRIVRLLGSRTLVIGETWDTSAGFFSGFEIGRVSDSASRCLIQEWDTMTGMLTLQEQVPKSWGAGDLVELRTREEAPVLGMRLITGTGMGQAFPPLTMRVATTRATNALLERKGSRVALFITSGFADLLAIGDQRRADLFALKHEPRAQFHECSVEVHERLDARGNILIPLNEAEVKRTAADLINAGITHAAVALMHSFVNPAHEKRVAELLYAEGFEHVSLSSGLAPFAKILPRAQSGVANAYLTGPVQSFLQRVAEPLGDVSLQVMTSAGGLEPASAIKPKDMLLSGPAGGAIGAANAAKRVGFHRIITFDMGGTSTDVARLDGRPGYRFSQSIAGMNLLAPCVAVETVAAGGGSICAWTPSGLAVGPHSAGSNPGPACYGKGGPLTITDINLLLGRFDPERSPIPLDLSAAKHRLEELLGKVISETGNAWSATELLNTLLGLAVEHMADAIRKISVAEGYSPKEYALLAFGGAGPQHACAVASMLGMDTIIVPRHAGILSAVGLHEALPEAFAEKQVLMNATEAQAHLAQWIAEMVAEAKMSLNHAEVAEPQVLAEMRLMGQDTPLQVEVGKQPLIEAFGEAYARLFGYPPPAGRAVELVSLRVIIRVAAAEVVSSAGFNTKDTISTKGPALIQDAFSTLVVESGWAAFDLANLGYVLRRDEAQASRAIVTAPELLRHRFHSLVDDMGALLKRTSISTNKRERLDFTSALLNARGELVASAPHIPVHLGALGVCVRDTFKVLGWDNIRAGDTYITNHPAFGGSHLPDVTLITPVFDDASKLLGFVANRAHHAEIGGMTPGSMPATATHLIEEGVVIAPCHLVRAGVSQFD